MVFDALPFTSRPPRPAPNPARHGSRRDQHQGRQAHEILPVSRRRTPRCAIASGMDCSSCRVPRGAPRTPHDAEAGDIEFGAGRRVDPPRRPAETRAVRQPAGSTARPTRASHPSRRVPRGVPQTLGDAEAGDVQIGAGSRVAPPTSPRRNSRCAVASGIDREAGKRVLPPVPAPYRAAKPFTSRTPAGSTAGPASASCLSCRVPRGAPQTPRDAWAPPRHPAETPKPALRGRQRDQPRGQRARPTLRVASPLACPEPRATRKPARSVSGPAAAQPTPRHPAETPKTALRGRRRDRTRSQRARPALRVVSPATRPHATRKPAMTRSGPAGAQPPPRSPAETPKPALRGRQRDRPRGR